MKKWYFYTIRCRDGSLYTGIATDVERRFAEHQEQGSKVPSWKGTLAACFQKTDRKKRIGKQQRG